MVGSISKVRFLIDLAGRVVHELMAVQSPAETDQVHRLRFSDQDYNAGATIRAREKCLEQKQQSHPLVAATGEDLPALTLLNDHSRDSQHARQAAIP